MHRCLNHVLNSKFQTFRWLFLRKKQKWDPNSTFQNLESLVSSIKSIKTKYFIAFSIRVRVWNPPAKQHSQCGPIGQKRLCCLAGGFHALIARISKNIYSEFPDNARSPMFLTLSLDSSLWYCEDWWQFWTHCQICQSCLIFQAIYPNWKIDVSL